MDNSTSPDCPGCRDDLEHCHGTLIQHLLDRPECTDDGCSGGAAIPHAFTVDCNETGCRCGQLPALTG